MSHQKKNAKSSGSFFPPFRDGKSTNHQPAMIFHNGPKKKELVRAAPSTPFMQVRKPVIKKKQSNDT